MTKLTDVLERNGFKISRASTEFLELAFRNREGMVGSGRVVRPGNQSFNNVYKFKYLG